MYQNRALNTAERLKAKPLPHVKNRVTKPLSAFLASFLLLCRYTRCQIRAQSSLINLRLSFDRSRWYFLTTGAHENARREPSSAPSDMLGIKNPCAAQPALHKIPLCDEYCLIKNPRSFSRKTRVCSHAPDAHPPRKTNFFLICFLNHVVMVWKIYFLIQIYTKASCRRLLDDSSTSRRWFIDDSTHCLSGVQRRRVARESRGKILDDSLMTPGRNRSRLVCNYCLISSHQGWKRPKMRLMGIRRAQTDRHSVSYIVMQCHENNPDAFFRFTRGKTSLFAVFAPESRWARFSGAYN